MKNVVKSKEEFECLMKERKEKYGDLTSLNYNFPIKVKENGEPARKADRKAMCELQKLALGIEKGYLICGPICVLNRRPYKFFTDVKLKKGDRYRTISINVTKSDEKYLDRFFIRTVSGVREILNKPGSSIGDVGEFCEYPGGCD